VNGSDDAEFLLVPNHNPSARPRSWLREDYQRLASIVVHNARRVRRDVSTPGSGENAGPRIP
jgi:hypothetical protein